MGTEPDSIYRGDFQAEILSPRKAAPFINSTLQEPAGARNWVVAGHGKREEVQKVTPGATVFKEGSQVSCSGASLPRLFMNTLPSNDGRILPPPPPPE